MYYRVKNNFLLRGWKLLPFAIYDLDSHKAHFFDRKTFLVILKCDGKRDFEVQKLSVDEQDRLKGLVKRGIVEKTDNACEISEEQKYKLFFFFYIRRQNLASFV